MIVSESVRALTLLPPRSWWLVGGIVAIVGISPCGGEHSFEARRDAALTTMPLVAPVITADTDPSCAGAAPTFALVAMWRNEQVAAASEALRKYGEFFIANRKARNDQHSFYWSTELLTRVVSFFGREGTIVRGRLDAEVENRLLELMWQFVRETSYVDSLDKVHAAYVQADQQRRRAAGDPLPASANVAQTHTWEVIESENHHAMTWLTLWDFTRLLKDAQAYRERKFLDGLTAPEHHDAWCAYATEYIRQRARKGLFIEMADCTYNSYTLKGFYNVHDFAEDPVLRQLAGDLLTLYYASWAQEQLGGVRGGGKSRMNGAKDRRSSTTMQRLMYYYAGRGDPSTPASQRLAALTSGYRLPEVVIDIMTDPEGRGEYEIDDRPPGLATDGRWNNPLYRLRTDTGGIIRYAWCTPDFIMGLPMVRVRKNTHWTKLSSQGRWQGVIFAGDPDARIFVQCGRPDGSHNNQQAGVQRKGTMITQRLPEGKFARGTDGTRVWISQNGLTNCMEEAGWVFVEASGAYAAVRPARDGYTWQACTEKPADGSQWRGQWMRFEDDYSPAILEVARKSDYPAYAAFRKAVAALPLRWEGSTLHYEGLCGDVFVFHAEWSRLNTINGVTINDENPDFAFHSPFLTSRWDSGVVEIEKGPKKLRLSFRERSKTEADRVSRRTRP